MESTQAPLVVPTVSSEFPRRNSVQRDIAALVHHHLTNLHRYDASIERRKDVRYAFPSVIELIPVDPDTMERLGPPIFVAGKQISVSGMGFFHSKPIAQPYLLVKFEQTGDEPDADSRLVLKTKWCRFVGPNLYESGGQFIKITRKRR